MSIGTENYMFEITRTSAWLVLGRVVIHFTPFPRYWDKPSYHGGKESCCAFHLDLGPIDFTVGQGR